MGVLPVNSGDVFYILTDALPMFWRTGACLPPLRRWSEFAADVAALEEVGDNGRLRDDASEICLTIKKLHYAKRNTDIRPSLCNVFAKAFVCGRSTIIRELEGCAEGSFIPAL